MSANTSHSDVTDMTRKQLSDTSRRRVLQGTGAGAAAMLAGCLGGGGGDGNGGNGGNGGGGADPTELPDVFMLTDYNNEPWQGKWEDLSGSFTEETDIGVNIEYSGMSGQQENRLATLIQSGNPPDVNTSTFDRWPTSGRPTGSQRQTAWWRPPNRQTGNCSPLR